MMKENVPQSYMITLYSLILAMAMIIPVSKQNNTFFSAQLYTVTNKKD